MKDFKAYYEKPLTGHTPHLRLCVVVSSACVLRDMAAPATPLLWLAGQAGRWQATLSAHSDSEASTSTDIFSPGGWS